MPDAVWRLQPPIVVTTNYDRVLAWRNENSRRRLNDQPEELVELYRAADPQRPTVWHLHGHIERAASLILANSEKPNTRPRLTRLNPRDDPTCFHQAGQSVSWADQTLSEVY